MSDAIKNDRDDFNVWAVFADQAKRPNYKKEMEDAMNDDKEKITDIQTEEASRQRDGFRKFLFRVQATEGRPNR